MKLKFYKEHGRSTISSDEDEVALDATGLEREASVESPSPAGNRFREGRVEEREALLVLPPEDYDDEELNAVAGGGWADESDESDPLAPVGIDPLKAQHALEAAFERKQELLGFKKPLREVKAIPKTIEKSEVERMGHQAVPVRVRIRKKKPAAAPAFDVRSEPPSSPKTEKRWQNFLFAGGSLLFLTAGASVATALFQSDSPAGSARPEYVPERAVVATESDAVREELVGKAVAFLEASTWEDKLSFVRNPGRHRDGVRDFYEAGEKVVEEFEEITYSGLVDAGGTPKYVLHALLTDGSKRMLVFVNGPEGKRLDWPCYARTSEADWGSFAAERSGEAAEFRLVAHPDSYYNFSFGDSRTWACFRLKNLDSGPDLFGYVPRGSDLHLRLAVLFQDQPARLLMLRIAFPNWGEGRDQVEIVELTAVGWVKG